jgi:[protein-PII] uridylyltransferase
MLSELMTATAVTLADGGAPARRRAFAVDTALAELATKALGGAAGWALVAVGGYGRGELSPLSDLDLLVVTAHGEEPPRERLQELLYPLWDGGLTVGHAVRSPVQAIEQAADDLDAATALMSARLIAGDPDLYESLLSARKRWLRGEARALVTRLRDRTAERHRRAERAGWVLAPDLKDDIGGLRDLHAVQWLATVVEAATGEREHVPGPELTEAGERLLAVREGLHAVAGKRKTDRVRIDLQPAVAKRLGLPGREGADQLMAAVHTAARTIEHLSSVEALILSERVVGGPRRSGTVTDLGGGVKIEDGQLRTSSELEAGPAAGLRLLAARASTGRPIAPALIGWLGRCFDEEAPERWDPESRDAFGRLLAGGQARRALEVLDAVGGWPALLPEWSRVRGLAQYDLFHRYTVDGHLLQTVDHLHHLVESDEVAGQVASRVGGLETLYLAGLLHDVGKGSGTDHSLAGEALARSAGARMGLEEHRTEEIAGLVRWHLLLPNTATRRDLDDPAVVKRVAEHVGNPRQLHLLYLLTVADALATGPEAWTSWKDALVRELYHKALRVMDSDRPAMHDEVSSRAAEVAAAAPDLLGSAERLLRTFPASYLRSASVADLADELRLVSARPGSGGVRTRLDVDGSRGQPTVTVALPARPGTLSRIAGVLALNRISVLGAQVYTTSDGLALERFVVDPPPEADWDKVRSDLEAAHTGRLAVEARLERKTRAYSSSPGRGGADPGEVDVRVLADASDRYTVVEVRGVDTLGLLYAITAALASLDLDIHTAKIDTLGRRVVDVFYVRSRYPGQSGGKLSEEQAGEVVLAVRHRVARLLGD